VQIRALCGGKERPICLLTASIGGRICGFLPVLAEVAGGLAVCLGLTVHLFEGISTVCACACGFVRVQPMLLSHTDSKHAFSQVRTAGGTGMCALSCTSNASVYCVCVC
jgi:hypothetical protein